MKTMQVKPKGSFFIQDDFIKWTKKNPIANFHLIQNHDKMDKHPMINYKGTNLIPTKALEAAFPKDLLIKLQCEVCSELFL